MRQWLRGLNRKLEMRALALIALSALAAGQGTMTTVAGNGATAYSGDGGPASTASLNHQRGLAVSPSGMVYLADVDNLRIRAVNLSG